MYDKNFVLQKFDAEYDTIKVSNFDSIAIDDMMERETITIADVIAARVVNFSPECSPEYLATFRDIGGRIMKIVIDMSDYDNGEIVTFYQYL